MGFRRRRAANAKRSESNDDLTARHMSSTVKSFSRLVLAALAIGLFACAHRPPPVSPEAIEGRVLEQGSEKPIGGALVVMLWRGHLGYSGTICYHVATATTEANGDYRIPPQTRPEPYIGLSERSRAPVVYKPGYRQLPVQSQPGTTYLEPFTGGRGARLEYLSGVSVSCSHKREIEIELLPLHEALYEEASSLAVTREGKIKALRHLRDIEELEVGSTQAWENFHRREKELQ